MLVAAASSISRYLKTYPGVEVCTQAETFASSLSHMQTKLALSQSSHPIMSSIVTPSYCRDVGVPLLWRYGDTLRSKLPIYFYPLLRKVFVSLVPSL